MTGKALAIGPYSEEERTAMGQASRRGGVPLAFHTTVAKATASLRRKAEPPRCMLVSSSCELEPFVEFVRDRATLFSVPIVAVAEHPAAECYRRAYRAGVDDVLLRDDLGGLTRRMANLADYDATARPPLAQGKVAVVSTDDVFRKRVGRTLRQVGFEVLYSTLGGEIAELAPPPLFVVTDAVRADSGDVPVLELGGSEVGDSDVDVTSRILFFADEQRTRQFVERRAARRMLLSTMCSFRQEGALEPNVGVTHNVSSGGMYIRTLDPPPADSTLWIELSAPCDGPPVHLRGSAAWRRLPGAQVGVLPPGFGVRLSTEACPPQDLRAFLNGCAALEKVS